MRRALFLLATLGLTAASCAKPSSVKSSEGIHKIRHVVVIMQENRSFDEYFGTYPGADGIPRRPDGSFAVCLPSAGGGCLKPFHDTHMANGGGQHGYGAAVVDIDGGKMDGFVKV